MKTINFIVEKTSTGFTAYADDFDTLPVGTSGDTISELKNNIMESANLWLDHVGRQALAIDQIKLTLDVPSFFDFYGIISAKALSGRIGMNNSLLSQYAKGVKKPSPKQVDKILAGLKGVGRELMELELV